LGRAALRAATDDDNDNHHNHHHNVDDNDRSHDNVIVDINVFDEFYVDKFNVDIKYVDIKYVDFDDNYFSLTARLRWHRDAFTSRYSTTCSCVSFFVVSCDSDAEYRSSGSVACHQVETCAQGRRGHLAKVSRGIATGHCDRAEHDVHPRRHCIRLGGSPPHSNL
jgi:hypothetical protein